MRSISLAAAVASIAILLGFHGAATASSSHFRVTIAPMPTSLTTSSWAPRITLAGPDGPVAAPLALTVRSGARERSFRPRAVEVGSYRVRVVFPGDGRWRWALSVPGRTIARGTITVSIRVAFELPYDLAVLPGGKILFADRSRLLSLDAKRRVGVYARLPTQEITAFVRAADGSIFVADFPGGRILRLERGGRTSAVASVPAPADLYADSSGSTLWVASIAEGVGVVRVDVASGAVVPFSRPVQPHGIDRRPDGDFFVQDGRTVKRMDGSTGELSTFADVNAFKLLVAGGFVYGVEGSPRGGRVVRIAGDGGVRVVAGTGRLSRHRDGSARTLGILPSAVQLAPNGDLLVTQVEPVPAIRRVHLASGRMTTLALGRR